MSRRQRRRAGGLFAALSLAVLPVGPALSAPLRWSVFSRTKAAKTVRIEARYVDAKGAPHTLTLFRDGEKRLRRDTDDRLSIVVTAKAGGQHEFFVFDRARKLRIRATQANLFRIGEFTDFRGLAAGIREPNERYTLVATKKPPSRTAFGGCSWYTLSSGEQTQDICWSSAFGFPLLIERPGPGGERVKALEVTAASHEPLSESVFATELSGYADIDADRDISGDD